MTDRERTPVATCAFVCERVELLPSGDLSRSEGVAVRAHLADCVACRRVLRASLDARNALAAATGVEMPPAGGGVPDARFFDDLQADILAAVAAPGTRRRWLPRAIGGIAAALMFSFGLWFGALGDGRRPRLLDAEPIAQPAPSAVQYDSWIRPVGLTARTGLRGRAAADAMLLATPAAEYWPASVVLGRREFGPVEEDRPMTSEPRDDR